VRSWRVANACARPLKRDVRSQRGFEVSLLTTIGLGAVAGVAVYFMIGDLIVAFALRQVRRQPLHGATALVGRKATVVTPFSASSTSLSTTGSVRIDGETWRAELAPDTKHSPTTGDDVLVVKVSGLLLTVKCC
jgi:membrane protein implicated in regulation of membrane protease activity